MAYRRIVVRCFHDRDLSGSEQKAFADDVQSRLDGTDINGYFLTSAGTDWLEWEGDAETVSEKYRQHVDDRRIQAHEVVEDTEVNDLNTDEWRAHTQPDIHCELL